MNAYSYTRIPWYISQSIVLLDDISTAILIGPFCCTTKPEVAKGEEGSIISAPVTRGLLRRPNTIPGMKQKYGYHHRHAQSHIMSYHPSAVRLL